jgi:hypothetical protein
MERVLEAMVKVEQRLEVGGWLVEPWGEHEGGESSMRLRWRL